MRINNAHYKCYIRSVSLKVVDEFKQMVIIVLKLSKNVKGFGRKDLAGSVFQCF